MSSAGIRFAEWSLPILIFHNARFAAILVKNYLAVLPKNSR